MTLNKLSNLQQRLAVSTLSIVFLLIAISLSYYPYFRPFFSLLGAIVISVAVWELYFIGKSKGYKPLDTLGMGGTIAFTLSVFLSTQTVYAKYLPETVMGFIVAMSFIYYFIKDKDPFVNLSITFFAFIYLTIPLSTLIAINYFFLDSSQDGRWWLLYLLGVVKMTDIGAFFIGKLWGKRKLAPFISPKKTWEGAIGGLGIGCMTGFFIREMALFWNPSALSLSFDNCLGLSIVISAIGQFGDLAESLLKRDGGIKDSNQLPGLGGMLDVVDSLVFAAPVLYLYLKLNF